MSDSPCRSGWEKRNLISLAQYLNGRAFREDEWGEEGLPIIRIEQINDPSTISDRYDGPVLRQNLIDDGDLVFSWSATLKAVIWKDGPAALNQHLFKVVPNAGVDRTFLKQLLDMNMERLAASSQGSTMKHVPRSALERYRACVPASKDEQASIAEILSTVDEAIEGTEKLIAKHQQIRAGLMHDLFTRGLTPDGHLRPPHTECPDLYKDSPLGPIPKEWEVRRLDRQIRVIDCKHYTPVYREEGFPVIRPRNIKIDGLDLSDVEFVSRHEYEILTDTHKPGPGDIVFSRNASFGVPCYVSDDLEFAIGQDVVVMTKSVSNTRFVFCGLCSDGSTRQISRASGGSTFGRINLHEIRSLLLPFPGPDEQKEVAERIFTASSHLESLKREAEKRRRQKHGLMHDLLTGEVEVALANDPGVTA